MSTRLLVAALFAALAAACSSQVSKIPCTGDATCPTGSYCRADGSCAPLPGSFSVVVDAPAPVTAGKTLKLVAHAVGGVAWAVQEPSGGTVDADGTYHAPLTPGTYHAVATSTADAARSATVAITVAPVPQQPGIQAPAVVTAGQSGFTASLGTVQQGMTYSWSIAGGQLSDAAGGATVGFSAGSGTSLTLTCRATNAAGDFSEASKAVPIAPVPTTPTLVAPSIVTSGKSGLTARVQSPLADLTYAWTIGGGSFTSAPAGGSVSFSVDAAATAVQLGCVATNAAGVAAPAAALSIPAVAPPPSSLTIAAPGAVTANKTGYTASVPAQAGMTYAWAITGGAITAGAATEQVTFTAGATGPLQLTLVLANAALDSASYASSNIAVVPAWVCASSARDASRPPPAAGTTPLKALTRAPPATQ